MDRTRLNQDLRPTGKRRRHTEIHLVSNNDWNRQPYILPEYTGVNWEQTISIAGRKIKRNQLLTQSLAPIKTDRHRCTQCENDVNSDPPKVEVARSNRVGRAIKSST